MTDPKITEDEIKRVEAQLCEPNPAEKRRMAIAIIEALRQKTPPDPPAFAWRLSGEYRYLRGLFGALRLQVEEMRRLEIPVYNEGFATTRNRVVIERRWRAALFSDMKDLRDIHGLPKKEVA